MAAYEPSLCWECQNTSRFKCPWFNPADPQPVPGWVAERRVRPLLGETYTVKECPKFEPEQPREIATPPSGENVPGVRWRKTAGGGSWEARIMHDAKNYSLGCFKTQEQAIAARRAAEEAIARGEEPKRKEPSRKVYQRKVYPPGHCPGVRREGSIWEARITRKGKMYYLGHFKTEEAAGARLAAEAAIKRGEEPQRKPPRVKKSPPTKGRPGRSCPGVYFRRGYWEARACYQGKVTHLGCFKTEEEAIAARKAAEDLIRRGMAPRKNT